jgi:hypothetical protein
MSDEKTSHATSLVGRIAMAEMTKTPPFRPPDAAKLGIVGTLGRSTTRTAHNNCHRAYMSEFSDARARRDPAGGWLIDSRP